MKNLLLFFVLIMPAATGARAQGYRWHTGDTFYYTIRSDRGPGEDQPAAAGGKQGSLPGNAGAVASRDDHYIFRIRVAGKKNRQYRLQCTLLYADLQGEGFHFRSDDVNTLPLNTTEYLPVAALLQKPFTVWINDNGSGLSTHGPDSIAAASCRAWSLPEQMTEQVRQNAAVMFPMILRPLFFAYPDLPLSLHGSWYSGDSTMAFRVRQVAGDSILVTGAGVKKNDPLDRAAGHACTFSLDKASGNILSFHGSSTGYIQTGSGKPVSLKQERAVRLLPWRPDIGPFDRGLLRTRVCMSTWSDSLKTGVEYDSAKIHRFLAANDTFYGHDSAYIIHKLALLQQLNDYKQYDEQLLKTPNRVLRSSPSHLHNKLQDVYGKDPDSALSIIRLFSHTGLFNNWVQDSYAQSFITKETLAHYHDISVAELSERKDLLEGFQERRKKCDSLLTLLMQQKDTIYNFMLKPLQLWDLSQQAKDPARLKQIAAAFEKLDRRYLWYGRSARYGMLIYKQLKDAGLQQASDTLLNRVITQLKQDQADSLPGDAVMQITRDRRPVHKALLADAYYLAYQNERNDQRQAMQYLGKAALYSPSDTKEEAYESFYDRALLGSKKSYRPDFARALMKEGDKKAALKVLTTTLQTNPLMVSQVRSMYDSLAADSTFPAFFMNALVSHWKPAKDFSLKDREGKAVALKDFSGRWLLMDFWGTWCAPCRREMPETQRFYDEITGGKRPGLSLLTVAAYDTPERVTMFFKTHHYNLPVAMADDAIIKDYEIPGYPSKVLISPDGTWLPILFGTDWQDVVKNYMDIYREYRSAGPGQQLKGGKLD